MASLRFDHLAIPVADAAHAREHRTARPAA
jgi:hypothetical protein